MVSERAVSVVIPTYNRRERLDRVLAALDEQRGDERFDVVVVDDGSNDGTAEGLAGRTFEFRLRVVRQEKQGPAAARNAGLALVESPLVLFIDDDLVPSPG